MSQVKVGIGATDSRIHKPMSSGAPGGASNSFTTISTSSGTSPVADSATDTLTITGTAPIVVTGDSTTDTVTISTTSATVPAGTTIYDHLEWDGSAWQRVQNLRLNSTSELRFDGTTNYLKGTSSTALTMNSGAVTIHSSSGATSFSLASTTRESISISGSDLYHTFHNTGNPFAFHWTTSGSTIDLYDAIAPANVVTWGTTYQLMVGTNRIRFNASTETVYSSTTNQLDLTSGGLIKSHAVTEIRDVINSNTARSVTTSEHRWYISGNDNLYLDASVGSGKLGYYTGAVTTAYATWSSATWQLINANNSGIISIQALADASSTIKLLPYDTVTIGSGVAGRDYILKFDGETNDGVITWMEDEDYFKFSDDVLMDSTERIYFNDPSQSIWGDSATTLTIETDTTLKIQFASSNAGKYFDFDRVTDASQQSRITFYCYDAGASAIDEACDIRGYVYTTGEELDIFTWRMRQYVDDNELFRLEKTFQTSGSITDYTARIFPAEVAAVTWTYALAGSTQLFGGTGTISATNQLYFTSSGNTIVFDGSAGTFNYSGSTFYIGGNSASGRTVTLQNGGIGSFTCNIVSSTEWSFTSTELTVGTGNHIYIKGGGQSRYRDSTTYVYSSATNTLDLVVSSSSRAVLTAGALTMGSATTIVCAAATTSIPSIRVPAGTAPTSPTEGDVWNDSTQKCPVNFTDGIKVYGGGIIYSQVTNTTIANTTSETTLTTTTNATGTLTLPANWWTRGKVMRVTAAGVFSTKSGTTPTGRIRLFKGATELCTSSAKTIPDIGGTSRLWTCVIYVTGLSTAFTSVMSQGTFQWINASVSVGAAHVFEVNNQTGGVATAVTIGATSEAIDLKWTWGTADALDTITCTNLIIEVIA